LLLIFESLKLVVLPVSE